MNKIFKVLIYLIISYGLFFRLNKKLFVSQKANFVIQKKLKNNNFKNNAIFLRKIFNKLLKDIPKYNHTHIYSNIIFWCWLQGKNNISNISLSCLNSVYKNCKKYHNIKMITENNMLKYIKLPSYIIEKYNKKYIGKAHFCDLLRIELLIKFGGTWVDSTILITKYDESFFRKDLFFFSKINDKYSAGSNWFITSEKGNPILKTTRDLLYEYWRINNKAIDYFFFHIFFKMACEKYFNDFQKVKKYSSKKNHEMSKYLFKKFQKKKYEQIVSKISIHKLTNKKVPKEKGLFYHYIISKYKKAKI